MEERKTVSILRAILAKESYEKDGLSNELLEVFSQMELVVSEHGESIRQREKLHERLENLLDVLVEFAQFNFDMEIPISEEADELDGIALGLQTLGQEIEFYQRELEITNQNLLEAQEMAHIGSWEVQVDTREMHWSLEMYNIYGMERNGNDFKGLRDRFSVEDTEKLEYLFDRAVKYHEPYQLTMKIDVNGEEKYIDAQAKPVFDNGELKKIVGTVMDVTSRHIAQRRLEFMNNELEQKVAERTKDLEGFSYSVSHDLRAPLRSILGFSNILAEKYDTILDEEGHRLLDIIIRNSAKMSTLIEELLTFSRVGVTVPNFQEVDINMLMRTTWNEVYSAFEQKDKVNVTFEEMPTIFGASSLLNQVFSNLFSNALKYSSKNEEINISIKHRILDSKKIEIVIEDNGCGFNMKYHEKLFGVFQRLHSEDEFPGTGVGLALVKRIVDKHHGKIWAESEVGQGSKFYLTLPLESPTIL